MILSRLHFYTERDVIASKAKAVITNNYTTGSVAKIKSDDFEFIKVDEKLSDVLEPALFMLDNGAVPSILKDKLDKYSSTSAPRIGNT